jgi:hypothetical protein
MTVQEEHEAFKNRLVEDVFGSDAGDKVPMEKVVMLLWQFRDDASVITFMARFVAKVGLTKCVRELFLFESVRVGTLDSRR